MVYAKFREILVYCSMKILTFENIQNSVEKLRFGNITEFRYFVYNILANKPNLGLIQNLNAFCLDKILIVKDSYPHKIARIRIPGIRGERKIF